MYFIEQEIPESDILTFIQEAVASNDDFKEQILQPIINVLDTKQGRDKYIEIGSEFIEANADMLSKEFPTKTVSHPRRYVDRIFEIFNFNQKEFKKNMTKLLRDAGNSDYRISENPTNIIHTIVLFYSDIIKSAKAGDDIQTYNKALRDSARQQLGLSTYRSFYKIYFSAGFINEDTMAFTYLQLNGKWSLVKSENMINWLASMIETPYQFWRSRISLNMSVAVIAGFLGRVNTTFNQNMRHLSGLYYKNIEEKNAVGSDVDGDDDYVITNNFMTIRNNLILSIRTGDGLYSNKNGKLYPAIGRLKNVKVDTLYEMAQKVEYKDISKIIDNIFYVFLIKEGNSVGDINSSKYISKITNLPTAVDRAIAGKPIIAPMVKKYHYDSSIVKAYICLIATYIMFRINDINQPT